MIARLRQAAVVSAIITGFGIALTIALALGVIGALWLFSWISI